MTPHNRPEVTYVLRFFFDYGSDHCLWSANDAARQDYGYPVVIERLNLSAELVTGLRELALRYDTSIDMSDPGGPSLWTAAEAESFLLDARATLTQLRHELGAAFLIQDEL